jgi:hypothetical protein
MKAESYRTRRVRGVANENYATLVPCLQLGSVVQTILLCLLSERSDNTGKKVKTNPNVAFRILDELRTAIIPLRKFRVTHIFLDGLVLGAPCLLGFWLPPGRTASVAGTMLMR